MSFPPSSPLPSVADALLAMLGALPDDDALVLGQSGPAFTAEQSAGLTAWRLQQAYQHLLAVSPLWAALLDSPERVGEVEAAFSGHPWQPLVRALLPAWCERLLGEQSPLGSTAANATQALPDLEQALRAWQRLHEQHWQALALPPLVPPGLPMLATTALPRAAVPAHWQATLQVLAERAGGLAAQALQHVASAVPGARATMWQRDGVILYRYAATDGSSAPTPSLLLVYAWVNDCQVLDLAPEQSLIAALQAQGITVWLLDWSAAGARGFTVEQYLAQLHQAVASVREAAAIAAVPLLGICQGGSLALMYAALHPEQVASLSLAATPVDFHCGADRLSAWTRSPAMVNPLSALASMQAHSPALLNLLFLQLKPFSLRLGKYLSLLLAPPSAQPFAAFLRLEHWLMAGPLLSGPGLAEYGQQCYRDNRLIESTLQINGQPVDLSRLTMPLQVLVADSDHIVPPAASLALTELGCADILVERFATGHIGLLVGRARLAVAEKVANFLHRPRSNRATAPVA